MAVTHDHDGPRREPSLGGGPRPDRLPRESVAETLRRAREGYGQDLRSVSQALRIRHVYLEAIESGDFDRLPGTAYAIGFLRTYAEYLGLDGAQIVDRFKEEVEGAEARTELVFPEPVGEGRIPGGAIILISVLLLGLAYGGWLYFSDQGTSISDVLPDMPERLQSMLAAEQATPAEAPATGPATGAAGTPQGPAPAPAAPGSEPTAVAPPAETPSAVGEPAPPGAGAEPAPPVPPGTGTAPEPAPARPAAREEPAAHGPVSEPEIAGQAVTEEPAIEEPVAEAPIAEAPVAEDPPVERPVAAEPPLARAEAGPAPASEPTPSAAPPAPPALAAPGPVAAPGDAATDAQADLMAQSPIVEQTVVIPAPPSGSQSLVIPTARTPRVYGEQSGDSRIVLRAVEDSWVQVRDAQDALLLTRVLRAGDAYYVPNQDGLTLLTGNAGGIEIEVDGVTAPPLGPVGSVRRQIALDPRRLMDGTAAPR